MSQNMQTLLLSLATSLVVSMVTFILGLKAGKNQVDRSKLQEIYKQLHSHFSTFRNSLIDDCPKLWEHYKKNGQYLPLVKELENSGDILFIKKKIANLSIELEKQLLGYTWNLKKHIPNLHYELVANLDMFHEGYSFKTYRNTENEKAHFEGANPTKCNSFFSEKYYILYNKEKTLELFKKIESCSCGVEFCLGNPMEYTFKIYPDSLSVNADEYVKQIFMGFQKNISVYNDLCEEKIKLIKKIDLLLKMLEKRVREPIGFWETILGAFTDMFH